MLEMDKKETILEGQIVDHMDPRAQKRAEHEAHLQKWETNLKDALKHHKTVSQDPAEEYKASLEQVMECYLELGYWDDVIRIEQKLFPLYKEKREQADSLHRLGSLYLQLQNFSQARHNYKASLKMFYEIHGGVEAFHRDMGKLLIGLGGVCVHEGNPEEALPLLAQAEEHYRHSGMTRASTGTDVVDPHPEIVAVLKNQAVVHRMLGQHQVAIDKFKEMLNYQQRYEPTNLDKRDELQLQIADCLFTLNQLNDALHYFETLLQDKLDREGGRDETTPMEGIIRHFIGIIHSKQGNPDEALRELESAYAIKKQTLGEVHPEVISTLNGLGAVHASLGNQGEALSYFRESLMIARIQAGSEGDKDPQVMQTLRNIQLVHDQGRSIPKWE